MTIRLGALDELNARPLWYSLKQDIDFDLRRAPRKVVVQELEEDAVDVALVSVVVAAQRGWHRVPGAGIAVAGRVDSIFVLSDVPLSQAEIIYTVADSWTSKLLLQALLRRMGRQPATEPLSGTVAVARTKSEPCAATMLIGDRGMKARSSFKHCWNLTEEWHAITGLPLVMGAWASKRPVAPEVAARLVRAAECGERLRSEVAINAAAEGWIDAEQAERYLSKLHFRLGPKDEEGLSLFLSILHHYGLMPITDRVPLVEKSNPRLKDWIQDRSWTIG